jgi:hypothetical protein
MSMWEEKKKTNAANGNLDIIQIINSAEPIHSIKLHWHWGRLPKLKINLLINQSRTVPVSPSTITVKLMKRQAQLLKTHIHILHNINPNNNNNLK